MNAANGGDLGALRHRHLKLPRLQLPRPTALLLLLQRDPILIATLKLVTQISGEDQFGDARGASALDSRQELVRVFQVYVNELIHILVTGVKYLPVGLLLQLTLCYGLR